MIVVPAASPAKSLKDLIAMAKAEPGKLTFASAGTPREVVAKRNGETNRALADPATVNKLAALGVVVVTGTPEQFARFIQAQTELGSGVIKAAGITPG